jgi:hypothetical protein
MFPRLQTMAIILAMAMLKENSSFVVFIFMYNMYMKIKTTSL